MNRRKALLGASVAALTMLLIGLGGPATAHHGPPHSGTAPLGSAFDRDGDADSNAATAFMEDADSDGVPNNIADAGDNAHPSGKDRSVESGGFGTQGRSESIPDQDGRGPERDTLRTDKPNGPGGTDIVDQDGNNGCGNDDDFDDDNEGWCGRRTQPLSEIVSITTTSQSIAGQAAVAGGSVELPAVVGAPGPPGSPGVGPGVLPEQAGQPGQPGQLPAAQVLGEVVVRGEAAAAAVLGITEARSAVALAFTGAGVADVVAAALGLLIAGVAIRAGGQVGLRRGRRDR